MAQGPTKGIPLDTDGTLAANSDQLVATQKAVKTYADTKQPLDADLTAIANLVSAADSVPYFTGSGTAALATVTSAARSVLDDTTVAAMRTTLGIPAVVGGFEWTVVTKASDTGRNSTTTLAADPELAFTAVSGGIYEWQAIVIYVSAVGGTTPDLKVTFAEDGTLRGIWHTANLRNDDAGQTVATGQSTSFSTTAGTAATNRAILMSGVYWGGGGTAAVYWAQNTSNGNDTTVKTGSLLRYRRIL